MKLKQRELGRMILSGGVLLTASFLTACNTNDEARSAGIGAAAGAVIGGVIGNQSGSATEGAAIGAALGGAAGYGYEKTRGDDGEDLAEDRVIADPEADWNYEELLTRDEKEIVHERAGSDEVQDYEVYLTEVEKENLRRRAARDAS
jgi:uncharacterized protein YcfJ